MTRSDDEIEMEIDLSLDEERTYRRLVSPVCPQKHMIFCSCLCQASDLLGAAIKNAPDKASEDILCSLRAQINYCINTRGCRG
jgi:hypothetical protein